MHILKANITYCRSTDCRLRVYGRLSSITGQNANCRFLVLDCNLHYIRAQVTSCIFFVIGQNAAHGMRY
ncbi:hypothetical protein QVD17_11753 [Tagetes erecta]|uniref:Uncharacterized protein n=1 Tax=Tagetes erecta TaxID=13708 RepID=A0AAD8P2C1_TARER|nr:hypothetical protein QVD17_11753 [Tagetes erecta]